MTDESNETEAAEPPRTILFKAPRGTARQTTPIRLPSADRAPDNIVPSKSPTVKKLRHIMEDSEYKAFFQSLYDGILITDLKGRMIDVNRKAGKLCLCSREDLCGKTISEVVLGITPDVLDAVREALKTGRHVLVDSECLRSDGSIFSCEVAVTPLRLSGADQLCFSVRDITDREEAEQRLLAQEKELRIGEEHLRESLQLLQERERELARERDVLQSLMDTIPDRIFFKDEHGRFLRINAAMARFHGLSDPAEAVGKSDFDYFDEAEASLFTEDDRRVMEQGAPILDKMQEIHRPSGSTEYSTVSKVPVRDSEGRIVGLVGISRDVTARVQAEQALKAAQKQLARVGRLEATALFAGQIAHDFNNLLVPLLIYPEMIRKHLDKDSQAYKDLEVIESTAQQIADINQDLMALSRRGKVREQIVDLHTAVSDVVQSVSRGMADKSLKLDWAPSASVPNVKFDPPQLARVLLNLLQNALDAVGEQGRVELKTENVCLEEPFGQYVRISPGEYLKLTVADNGSGIPDAIKDKIFDPFFTTKSTGKKRGGSGLGLSVVYGIMSDHNSYVDVESEEGKGTVFSLYFPVCGAPPKREDIGHLPGGSEAILVVEDERLHRDVVCRLLRDLGYAVRTAADGEEALTAYESNGAFPDLVLLDVVLGTDMDGVETFRRMRERNPGQKAITVSGMGKTDRVEEGLKLGVARHLTKPLRMEPLALAVREELDRAAAPATSANDNGAQL